MGCKYFIWFGNISKVSVNNFEWIQDTSRFNKCYIKDYNGISDKRYFLEVSVQYTEKLHELHNDLPFLPETIKIENVEKLFYLIYMLKLNMLYTQVIITLLYHRLDFKKCS